MPDYNLDKMTVNELRDFARQNNIKGQSYYNKKTDLLKWLKDTIKKHNLKNLSFKKVKTQIWKYEYTLPDGRVWKETSKFEYDYGLIVFKATLTDYTKGKTTYSNWKWVMSVTGSSKRIDDSIRTIEEMHKSGHWKDYKEWKKVKLIKIPVRHKK
ncbi:MAG: hypothetical protein ACFFG0_54500 [Candidatus Thorarchaeota archaeon]